MRRIRLRGESLLISLGDDIATQSELHGALGCRYVIVLIWKLPNTYLDGSSISSMCVSCESCLVAINSEASGFFVQ